MVEKEPPGSGPKRALGILAQENYAQMQCDSLFHFFETKLTLLRGGVIHDIHTVCISQDSSRLTISPLPPLAERQDIKMLFVLRDDLLHGPTQGEMKVDITSDLLGTGQGS